MRRLLSIPILFLTVFLRDLNCSSLRSLFVNRSARLWSRIFYQRFCESLFCFLSDRAYLVLKSLPQVLTRLRCVRDVLTPCAARMILMTSSSIPSSAASDAGGREWARMGGILHGAVHGASSPWSMADFSVSVPLGNKTDRKLSSPLYFVTFGVA